MTQPNRAGSRSRPLTRLLATTCLALAFCLLVFGTAAPTVFAAPTAPLGLGQIVNLVEIEPEEEGEEEAEEEAEGEELEEGEEEFEVAGGTVYLPAECLLRSAEPTVIAQHNNLHLTLRYTADSPTRLSVDYWLKGDKGSLRLGSATRHISKQGVLRLSRHLSEHEAAKVRAARAFVVNLDLPAAPSYCKRYLTLRLTTKHLRGGRATWSE